MKIDELLDSGWKDFINKNAKWFVGVLIRYVSYIAIGGFVLLFIFLNYIQVNCGGSNGDTPVFVIKQGKTINVTKLGKDNNLENVKDIDALIKELEALKEK